MKNKKVTAEIRRYIREWCKATQTPVKEIEREIDQNGLLPFARSYNNAITGLMNPRPRIPKILEDALFQHEQYIWNYMLERPEFFRANRWQEAEKFFIQTPLYATNYAYVFLQGRWPEWETLIKTNCNEIGMQFWTVYCNAFHVPDEERILDEVPNKSNKSNKSEE